MSSQNKLRELIEIPGRVYMGRLAEDYDGVSQYATVSLARSSVAAAYKVRVAAGDFGGGRRIPINTPVVVTSVRGQLEVLLGNRPRLIALCQELFSRTIEHSTEVGPFDTFTRSVSGSWGTPETADWSYFTYFGTNGTWQVSSGEALLRSTAFPSSVAVGLEDPDGELTWATDVELLLTMRLSSFVSSSALQFLRILVGGDSFAGVLLIPGTNTVELYGDSFQSGSWNFAAVNPFYLRLQLQDGVIRFKMWESGDVEPEDWFMSDTYSGTESKVSFEHIDNRAGSGSSSFRSVIGNIWLWRDGVQIGPTIITGGWGDSEFPSIDGWRYQNGIQGDDWFRPGEADYFSVEGGYGVIDTDAVSGNDPAIWFFPKGQPDTWQRPAEYLIRFIAETPYPSVNPTMQLDFYLGDSRAVGTIGSVGDVVFWSLSHSRISDTTNFFVHYFGDWNSENYLDIDNTELNDLWGNWCLVRFRVEENGIKAKIWVDGTDEPTDWMVSEDFPDGMTGFSGLRNVLIYGYRSTTSSPFTVHPTTYRFDYIKDILNRICSMTGEDEPLTFNGNIDDI